MGRFLNISGGVLLALAGCSDGQVDTAAVHQFRVSSGSETHEYRGLELRDTGIDKLLSKREIPDFNYVRIYSDGHVVAEYRLDHIETARRGQSVYRGPKGEEADSGLIERFRQECRIKN